MKRTGDEATQPLLRVAHIITKLELGGAQINTLYTYENLDRRKFNPYLICGEGGILDTRVRNTKNFIKTGSLARPIHPWMDLKTVFAIRKTLKKINPHIVHTHSSKAGIIGRVAAQSLRVPVIIHSVHGFSFSPFHGAIKRRFYQVTERLVARFTTHFVFVSHQDIETARHMGLILENYSLIRSGFPFEQFIQPKTDHQDLRQRYKIPKDAFVCGIVAPFKPQKGLFHLIDIAARVLEKRENIIFLLAGDGEERRKIEAELRRRNIEKNFRLPGFIDPIGPVLDLFDCAISTALWEGLPQSLVQFRLKKIPVLASDIPGNREVIQNNKNGFLIAVDDHETFCLKLLYLIDHPNEKQRLATFADDYSEWRGETMVKRQEQLYFSLFRRHVGAELHR